jgi:hypothetical protein
LKELERRRPGLQKIGEFLLLLSSKTKSKMVLFYSFIYIYDLREASTVTAEPRRGQGEALVSILEIRRIL